jgi:gliding motility associated protien GldN
MKTKLLIILFSVCSAIAFGQTKPKPKAPLTAKQKAAAAAKNKAAANKQKAGAANQNAGVTPVQQPSVTDTTNKITGPVKPFERPLDGYYKKSNILTAKVTPYAPLREADVIWSKRIWEEFDLREKMNSYMGSPKSRLIDVLMSAVMAGELTAYDPNPNPGQDDPGGDKFSRAYTPAEAKGRLSDVSLVQRRDANNEIIDTRMVANDFNPDSIVRFRIKEDYYFDKQRSIYEPRIIGIAPLFKPKGASGVSTDFIPAFWIYFPDARQVLATKEVANRDNDATGLSYDDVFMKRMFTAYIVKQTNDKDERIRDYADGIDRLYESQRIKKALLDWELDLWQY